MSSQESYLLLQLDLTKAFDILYHEILKMKLKHYGFRSNFLKFLMNFIKDREYFVSANGHTSDKRTVNIGVPKGSTLGPLLFLLYNLLNGNKQIQRSRGECELP